MCEYHTTLVVLLLWRIVLILFLIVGVFLTACIVLPAAKLRGFAEDFCEDDLDDTMIPEGVDA